MSKYLVETENLTREFKNQTAVDGLNLKIKEGRIYGFLGPNGAGKSTTLKMLLGLMQPTKGKATLFGMDIKTNREKILRQVGAIVDSPSYYGNLTAKENLEITREVLGLDKSEIDRVLSIVDLKGAEKKAVKEFSLGMKQRLAIANALMGSPKLLILDEPTNGLDPSGIHEIRELIKSLPSKFNTTVIVSSHLLSEVELMAEDVGIINKGKLIFQGELKELIATKEHGVIVETTENEKAAAQLTKNGYRVCFQDKNKLQVRGKSLTPERLAKELVLLDYSIKFLSEIEKNLEEVFLDLTQGVAVNDR
jgi:lantibiotic transport system ATP-binding protein